MIEERTCCRGVGVRLRTDGMPIRRALLAPSRQGLSVTEDGKYQSVVVPAVCGYQMVVFKEASDA